MLSVPGSPAPLSPSFLEYRLNIIQKHHLEIIFGDPSKKLYFHKLFVCFSAGTKNDTIPQDETNESFKGLTNGRTWRGSFSVELLCWPVRFLFLTPSHFVFYLLPPFKFAPTLTRSVWSAFYYDRASRDARALRFVWDTLCCVNFFCWNFCWFFCHSKIYSLLLTSCAGTLFVTLWSCHFQGQMIEIDITCWSFCGILSNWFWPSIQKKSNYYIIILYIIITRGIVLKHSIFLYVLFFAVFLLLLLEAELFVRLNFSLIKVRREVPALSIPVSCLTESWHTVAINIYSQSLIFQLSDTVKSVSLWCTT